ncbi:MAG: elongation factor P, partial [Methylocystis sp.]
MKVIASSIRKGNIIERDDGQLYVVLTAESFFPGKGTPTTQIDMRRLSDGVKTSDRYKTTEQVERAFVEDQDFSYLYNDGDGYHFMNQASYEQIIVPTDVIGDQAQWLQEGMVCILSMFNGVAVGIQLPPRVTLEI